MADYRVISADDHVIEPVDLWTSRAESKFKDRVPHVESLEEGDWWFCDDCLTFAGIVQFPLGFQATGPSQRDSRANSNGFQKKNHQLSSSDG